MILRQIIVAAIFILVAWRHCTSFLTNIDLPIWTLSDFCQSSVYSIHQGIVHKSTRHISIFWILEGYNMTKIYHKIIKKNAFWCLNCSSLDAELGSQTHQLIIYFHLLFDKFSIASILSGISMILNKILLLRMWSLLPNCIYKWNVIES